MTTVAQSVATDLAPLGPLADRSAAYVLTGKSADVLAALEGHAGELGLVVRAPSDVSTSSRPHPRPVLREFKQGDVSEAWNAVKEIAETGTGFDPAWRSKVG